MYNLPKFDSNKTYKCNDVILRAHSEKTMEAVNGCTRHKQQT